MAERRRVVPDNSVMIPAFFKELHKLDGISIDLTNKAKRLLAAIQTREVVCFAPDILQHEFLKTAFKKMSNREQYPEIPFAVADGKVRDFRGLGIIYVPHKELVEHAWRLMTEYKISPADCWYVACAILHDAELWISHPHKDQLAKSAAQVHPGKVFT